ncbi:MAG: uridine kinase [Saprospiraceae bacterium]|nr:uridine kinase [Saprospiraceae bacterium]
MPTSINHQLMYEDLQRIRQGLMIEKEKYNFNNEQTYAGVARLCPAPIILVEGIFIFHFERLRSLYDLKIFVHAKEDLKLIRRIKRDQIERNYLVEDVLYQYEHHVMPAYEKYIKPYLDEADIVVNNNITFERAFEVIRGFICNYLREIEYKHE